MTNADQELPTRFSGSRRGKNSYCFECMEYVVAGVIETRFKDDGIRRRTYLGICGHKFVTHEITIPPQPQYLTRRNQLNRKDVN